VQKLIDDTNTLNTEVDELQESLVEKNSIEAKLKKITKLESQIESSVSKYKKDISFFQQNNDCPTCRQTIEPQFKETEIANLTSKAVECEHGLSKLEKKLFEEQEKLNRISEVQKNVQKLQINIATNNTSITETNKYIQRLEKQILELQESKVISTTEQDELVILKSNLDTLKKDLNAYLEQKSYYEAASLLLKDTGIKTKIIKQYLPIINKLVNKFLVTLDFFVNFNLDESFKETIKSRHRDAFTYNNFSEGEKQRIDMALMLTWRAVAKLKNSSNTNLLILDEVFDSSLDTSGTEELMKILHMLEGVNLFVISHKGDVLQDKFSNVIRFEKVRNFSRIMK